MAVMFGDAPSLFKNPIGTAVGVPVINGSPANIVSISAAKASGDVAGRLSSWAEGIGGSYGGAPGSLSQYMSGTGMVTGITGSFADSISTNDGANLFATTMGNNYSMSVSGVSFHRSEEGGDGDSCNELTGNGVEPILAYFEDNHVANVKNAGRYTTVKIGKTVNIACVVVGVEFSMLDTRYNLWNWTLNMIAPPHGVTISGFAPAGATVV